TNLDVEDLTAGVAVCLFESSHTRLELPARRYQIGRIEETLLCLEAIERPALSERKWRQRRGFRISQLTACVVAELPQPRRPCVMAVGVEIGVLIVSGGVPRIAPLEALTARRHVKVEPERRGAVRITPRRRPDGRRIQILRDAEYVIVVSGFFLCEQRELVIPQCKCFRRRKEKAGDGNYPAHDSKPKIGVATGPAHQSHGRLRWKTGFDLLEFMPQACHGALEMGSGSAKASCESGF